MFIFVCRICGETFPEFTLTQNWNDFNIGDLFHDDCGKDIPQELRHYPNVDVLDCWIRREFRALPHTHLRQ